MRKRIKGLHLQHFQRILEYPASTNAALALAAGDYIVLADHDDIVPANALYELADALNQDRSIDVLYSDEDKISMDGKKRLENTWQISRR